MEEEAGCCPDSEEEIDEDRKNSTMKVSSLSGSDASKQGPSLSSERQALEGQLPLLLTHTFAVLFGTLYSFNYYRSII